MSLEKFKQLLKKQHYALVGNHSAVQICRWTKKSLLDRGFCYKQKFYGIESHKCCQTSPCLFCPNSCIHCWRAIEYASGKILEGKVDKPRKIIRACILAQRKLLSGFKGNKKVNMKKFREAQSPKNFAISLLGEPMIYPYIDELIKELRKQNRTSFIVTNALFPEKLSLLKKNDALPTQLYISLNTPNHTLYKQWHRSSFKYAWQRFNQSLKIFSQMPTRKVIRMTLVRNLNMLEPENYAKLIKKANPDFLEVKSYMAVGFARKRLGYEKMPSHEEIKLFAEKLEKKLKAEKQDGYKILDEKKESRVVLLGKNKEDIKIKI